MAKIEICSDWTALALKKAIQPFLGKGSAVSALIHEGSKSWKRDTFFVLEEGSDGTTTRTCFFFFGVFFPTRDIFFLKEMCLLEMVVFFLPSPDPLWGILRSAKGVLVAYIFYSILKVEL